MYFILLLNLETKAALKTTVKLLQKMEVKMYVIILTFYW